MKIPRLPAVREALRRSPLLTAGLCAVLGLALSTCSAAPSPAPSGERCLPEALATSFAALEGDAGQPVRWEPIESVADWKFLGNDVGAVFDAQDGDFLMANERIRAIVRRPGRKWALNSYGGTIVSADIQREDGVWHDYLGEIGSLVGLAWSIDVQEFELLRDGRDGVLVVGAYGPLHLADWLNLEGTLSTLSASLTGGDPRLGLNVPWPTDGSIQLNASQYYVLRSGESHIEMHTAICNPEGRTQYTTLTDMIEAGGNVHRFNTARPAEGERGLLGGFNLGSLDSRLQTLGFRGETAGYAVTPLAQAASLLYSHIGLIVHGTDDALGFLTGSLFGFDLAAPAPGIFRLPAGGSVQVARDIHVYADFDGLRTSLNAAAGETATAKISGSVRAGGAPFAGSRVALLDEQGRLETILNADAEGRYSGRVRAGSYQVHADPRGGVAPPPQSIALQADTEARVDFDLEPPAALRFAIRGHDPRLGSGQLPMPAKVSLVCAGPCPQKPSAIFNDVSFDGWPPDLQTQAMVDHEDLVSVMAKRGEWRREALRVPAGDYELIITRGPAFSRYVTAVTLQPGEERVVAATIDRVVDEPGWIGADTHVHTVRSFDSPVPQNDRVLTFAAEGVEILVATDHDYVSELGPVIAALGMEAYVTGIAGTELTFFDLGHFNAFPLRYGSDLPRGGAYDPFEGVGGRLRPPATMFADLRAKGSIDRPVVQINHARTPIMGYFEAIRLDTGTLEADADPANFRMAPDAVDRSGGLFSSDFDAFEVYNGYGDVPVGLNDLFALLNLGLNKVGVAVSDTHNWYASSAGNPRSLVQVGDTFDTSAGVTPERFARAMQAGRVIGGNGPHVELRLLAHDGRTARLGDTLGTSHPVTVEVRAVMPEWITIDTLEVFSNTPDVASRAGSAVREYPTAQYARMVTEGDFVRAGGAKSVTWTFVAAPARDAWFTAVARDNPAAGSNHDLFPLILSRDELPFAFTNAVFLDRDENGRFDAPGPQGEIQEAPPGRAPGSPLPADDPNRRQFTRDLFESLMHGHEH